MAREIDATIKSVLELLQSNIKFVIPTYQRPYMWEAKTQCEQLWEDVIDFLENNINNKESDEINFGSDEYFLGSIVVFLNDKKEYEVIDGQQRLTTLTLLYRALYEKTTQNKLVGWAKNFGKCIWSFDEGDEKFDFTRRKLRSDVSTQTDNELLDRILSKDYIADNKSKSNYAKNFNFFIEKVNTMEHTLFKPLCKMLIDDKGRLKILFIKCDEQENALRIFNTLNNRGLPLSDADIFKGIIYGYQKDKDSKENFAKEWRELEESLKEKDISIDTIFTYYTHVIRARNKDKSKEIASRKFYTKERLKDSNLFNELKELSDFWLGVFNENFSQRALQFLDVINHFPNQYPKSLISAFYFYCKDNKKDFFSDKILLPFLSKAISNILAIYINNPTVNAVKDPIFNAYVNLYDNGNLDFRVDVKSILDVENRFKEDFLRSGALTKTLISLNLYLQYENQNIIKGEVEHILPRNWQDTCYQNITKDEHQRYIESIGNKMWLEKSLNIKASNHYFKSKKERYKTSNFLEAKQLSELPQDEWGKNDIINREDEIFEILYSFIKQNL
ncbi:DUF262 domain-containing protein [Campylobacter mucosalis]|uniref:DUF262 domain-containing protein n=1 Tax=Campylobacter mucosalis TaxID=202 RepID=UPI00146FD426|nr:DUF262 domain-containing protein [Campylobacter mucosalis]